MSIPVISEMIINTIKRKMRIAYIAGILTGIGIMGVIQCIIYLIKESMK